MKTAARRAVLLLALGGFAGTALEAQQSQGASAPAAGQTNPEAPPQPLRARVSAGVAARLLRKRVAPDYPQKARDNRIQGTVVLKARITKEGDIAELAVISGDPLLAEAAVKAVMQWKYKPFLLNSQAVEIETTIQVNFTLSG
jgi:periplasmic protein TonB